MPSEHYLKVAFCDVKETPLSLSFQSSFTQIFAHDITSEIIRLRSHFNSKCFIFYFEGKRIGNESLWDAGIRSNNFTLLAVVKKITESPSQLSDTIPLLPDEHPLDTGGLNSLRQYGFNEEEIAILRVQFHVSHETEFAYIWQSIARADDIVENQSDNNNNDDPLISDRDRHRMHRIEEEWMHESSSASLNSFLLHSRPINPVVVGINMCIRLLNPKSGMTIEEVAKELSSGYFYFGLLSGMFFAPFGCVFFKETRYCPSFRLGLSLGLFINIVVEMLEYLH